MPWSVLPRARGPAWSLVSHLGVATLAAVVILLARPPAAPALGGTYGLALGESAEILHEPPAPSEMSVDLRGGTPTRGGPTTRSFGLDDRVGVVVRHSGRRSDRARLLVRVQVLSGAAAGSTPAALASPEIFVALDPRRVAWHGQSLHYEGTVGEILPLGEGLWRLTFMISDPQECAQPPLHVCARADGWLLVQ